MGVLQGPPIVHEAAGGEGFCQRFPHCTRFAGGLVEPQALFGLPIVVRQCNQPVRQTLRRLRAQEVRQMTGPRRHALSSAIRSDRRPCARSIARARHKHSCDQVFAQSAAVRCWTSAIPMPIAIEPLEPQTVDPAAVSLSDQRVSRHLRQRDRATLDVADATLVRALAGDIPQPRFVGEFSAKAHSIGKSSPISRAHSFAIS